MITIITVTYNAEETIALTLKSLLNQTYNKFQIIIKDAESKDKTKEIIEKYRMKFYKKKIDFKIVFSKDKSIYDGMNQALNYVEKEWVYFLNSGDTFYDEYVLENLAKNIIKNPDIDILYGSINRVLDKNNSKVKIPLEISKIEREMIFCHQGVLIKSELIKKEKYDITYKICADYNFFLKMYTLKKKFKKINLIFSNYDLNGFSNNNSLKAISEQKKISLNYIKNKKKINLYFRYLVLKELIKIKIKKIFGKKIFFTFRKINFNARR